MAQFSRRKFVISSAATAGLVAGQKTVGATAVTTRGRNFRRMQGSKTQIVFYNAWGTPQGNVPEELPASEKMIQAFNEQHDSAEVISMHPGGNYSDILTKVQAELAASNPVDLCSIPYSMMNFGVNGLGVQPVEDKLGDRLEDLKPLAFETTWPMVTWQDGTIRGIPFALSCPILYYNADIFEAAGVNPDEAFATWESLAAALPTLQDQLPDGGHALSFGANVDWPTQTVIQSNGGRVVDEEGTSFVFDSPEAVEAISMIAGFNDQGYWDASTTAEKGPNFFSGLNAIHQGSTGANGIRNQSPFNLGTAPFPTFGDKPRLSNTGAAFVGILSQDEEKYEAIADFFEFFFTDGYELWHETGYLNTSQQQDLPIQEGQEAAYIQLNEGLERETNWPGSRGVQSQRLWEDWLNAIFAGDVGVDEGIEEAKAELTDLLD